MAWEAYKAVVTVQQFARLMFLPPGTPDNIVRAYWDASEALVKNTEFRNIADPLVGKSAKWSVGEACDKAFKLNFRADPKAIEWLRGTLTKYGFVM